MQLPRTHPQAAALERIQIYTGAQVACPTNREIADDEHAVSRADHFRGSHASASDWLGYAHLLITGGDGWA